MDAAPLGCDAQGRRAAVAGNDEAQAVARGLEGGEGGAAELQGPAERRHGIAQEHGGRGIHHQPQHQVPAAFEALHDGLARAGGQRPVDEAGVIARHIRPVLHEGEARALQLGRMQALGAPAQAAAQTQRQAAQAGEEAAGEGHRVSLSVWSPESGGSRPVVPPDSRLQTRLPPHPHAVGQRGLAFGWDSD